MTKTVAQSPVPHRNLVFTGCVFFMLTLGSFGLALNTIQQPVLNSMGAGDSFSLITVITSVAMTVFTPVGGYLGDRFGAKKLVIYGGILAVVAGVLLGFCKTFLLYLIMNIILFAALGMVATTPFVLVRSLFEPRQLPRMIGLLGAGSSVGAIIGGYTAGALMDANQIFLAKTFPVVFLILGIVMIAQYESEKSLSDKKFDVLGFILLAAGLGTFFFGLNYGPSLGWGSRFVVTLIVIGLILIAGFIYTEGKVKNPLIPMTLFKNRRYSLLLIITGLVVFYLNAMNAYVPLGAQTIMGTSVKVSGSLSMPANILNVILPFILGTWIVKKKGRTWQALAYSTLAASLPFFGLMFIGPKMQLWIIYVLVAITAFSQSFRTVSVTPAVQEQLKPQEMAIGTSLIGFTISLSNTLSSTIYGIAYNAMRLATTGLRGQINAIDTVFFLAAVMGLIGFLLVIFVYRPMVERSEGKLEKKTA